MNAYTAVFIGHRDYDHHADARIEQILIDLIHQGYCRFLTGGMGEFDLSCADCVRKLKLRYPHILLCLVVTSPSVQIPEGYDEIILPEMLKPELHSVSIPVRNKLMVQSASAAICHQTRESGGAYASLRVAMQEALTIYFV